MRLGNEIRYIHVLQEGMGNLRLMVGNPGEGTPEVGMPGEHQGREE